MNFLRLRRTPKLAVPKHETDTFFVDADGVFKKMGPDGSVTLVGSGGGGGSTPVLLASRTLTNAEVLALPSTRIELVAPPGAGKMVAPLGAWLFVKKTTPYTGSETAHLFIGTLTDEYPMLTEIDSDGASRVASLLGDTSRASDFAWMGLETVPKDTTGSVGAYTKAVSEDAGPLTILEDEPLVVGIYGVGDLGGGDPANTLVVSVFYGVLDLPT